MLLFLFVFGVLSSSGGIAFAFRFAWRTSNFYGLPKIHKSKSVKDAVAIQNAEYIRLPPVAA